MQNTAVALPQQNFDAPKNRYVVSIAKHEADIEACLRLRYQVFAGEMKAQLGSSGLDKDRFDDYCQHLMVREENSGKVVATTRLLTSDDRDRIGFFYSETEFDADAILSLPGRFMEIGRTCIHPDYRNGATLGTLWQGLGKVTMEQDIDYLIGCASIPFSEGDDYMVSVMHQLRNKAYSPENLRAIPRIPVRGMEHAKVLDKVALPPLLKGYLRVGAKICGEPYWDAAFNVADVFILVETENLNARYSRHFFTKK